MTAKLPTRVKAARERARTGARFLDKNKPGWHKEIQDMAYVNMASSESCILGTVFGNYDAALEKLNLTDGTVEFTMGFNSQAFNGDSEYDYNNPDEPTFRDLHAAWEIEVIKRARKDAQNATA